jgi:hypothetical protein
MLKRGSRINFSSLQTTMEDTALSHFGSAERIVTGKIILQFPANSDKPIE